MWPWCPLPHLILLPSPNHIYQHLPTPPYLSFLLGKREGVKQMFVFPSPYLLILFSGEGTPSSREVGGGEDKPSHPPIFLCPAPLPPISISLLGKRERVKEQGMGRIGARCLIFPSPYYLLILFSSEGARGVGWAKINQSIRPSPSALLPLSPSLF